MNLDGRRPKNSLRKRWAAPSLGVTICRESMACHRSFPTALTRGLLPRRYEVLISSLTNVTHPEPFHGKASRETFVLAPAQIPDVKVQDIVNHACKVSGPRDSIFAWTISTLATSPMGVDSPVGGGTSSGKGRNRLPPSLGGRPVLPLLPSFFPPPFVSGSPCRPSARLCLVLCLGGSGGGASSAPPQELLRGHHLLG